MLLFLFISTSFGGTLQLLQPKGNCKEFPCLSSYSAKIDHLIKMSFDRLVLCDQFASPKSWGGNPALLLKEVKVKDFCLTFDLNIYIFNTGVVEHRSRSQD